MRLSQHDIDSIKQVFKQVFGAGHIFLFGSRVDDKQKGGDLDLYLKIADNKDIVMKKITFLIKLKQMIGDQKIDVIIAQDNTRPIEQEAMKYGVEL